MMVNNTFLDKFNKLLKVDRRIIYIAMFIAVSIPFFIKTSSRVYLSPWVQAIFDNVEEAAKKGKPILIGLDYDPSSLAELQPMSVAILRHAFSRNIKVVGINFIPNGSSLGASTLDEIAKEYGKKYGEDYAYMGFIPQYDVVLVNWGTDFRKSYSKDYGSKLINEIPILKNLKNYDDFSLVIDISGTAMPTFYITYGVTKFNFKLAVGVTAVSAAEYYAFLHSKQIVGLLAGMKAAAEYEQLLKEAGITKTYGNGMRGMSSQSWGHMAIIIFIIMSNIAYFLNKRRKRLEGLK